MHDQNIPFGVIFDMDGVVVHSMPFHDRAWRTLLARHGVRVDVPTLHATYGRVNDEILKHFFGNRFTRKEREALAEEKEALYREYFKNGVRATSGLRAFLNVLKRRNVPVALATAAPPENVRFVLDAIGFKKYFDAIIDASMVRKGKPHPEVFLKAARALGAAPERCVVFEDAMHGIEAARRAGMKVIALATTHPRRSLAHADAMVKDFTGVRIAHIACLFAP